MNSDCNYASDAAAYLADELPEKERVSYALHLAVCPTCSAAVESSERLIARLRSVPKVTPSRDLAPLILAKLHEPVRTEPQISWWPRLTAIAATIALIAGGSLFWKMGLPTAPSTVQVAVRDEGAVRVDRALDWFCAHQEANGSWDAAKWGGNARFQIALTALPLIALMEDPSPTPERVAAANRAIRFLRERQNPDGSFGETFRHAPYIQSVTTLALLHAYERQPTPELRRSLDAALKVVLESQTADGGWGYRADSTPNLPITLWYKEAVELAAKLGWDEAKPSVERVAKWIANLPSASLLAADDVDEIGSDYHRAYFVACSLREQKTEEALRNLAVIRKTLISQQTSDGVDAGTWAPGDQWGRAGGKIYSTALAAFVLR